jgi:hypothetical protein
MFVCTFAEFLARGFHPTFGQGNINSNLRARMALKLQAEKERQEIEKAKRKDLRKEANPFIELEAGAGS